jgi:hypothetical protein
MTTVRVSAETRGQTSAGCCIVALAGGFVACSGNAAHPLAIEDARGAQTAARDGGSGALPAPSGSGELVVTVEWKDVPVPARASPGRTPCGTPRPASVAPTTTWGIPDVIVLVDPATTKTVATGDARIIAGDCGITPRVALGDHLIVTSAARAPIQLGLAAYGLEPEASDVKPAAVPVQLPIAGHEVTRTLDAGIYQLSAGGEAAWIVAKANALVTDAAGLATFHDLPAGPHTVVAWLPARGDQPAKLVTAKATVTAGTPVDLTIDLGP